MDYKAELKKVNEEINRFEKIISGHRKTLKKLKTEQEVLELRVEVETLKAKANVR